MESMPLTYPSCHLQPHRTIRTSPSLQHHHPAAPTAQELARSALQVQIEPSVGNGSQAKTSCTRRFKSSLTLVTQQNQMSGAADGNGGGGKHLQVESVYIPHGESNPGMPGGTRDSPRYIDKL